MAMEGFTNSKVTLDDDPPPRFIGRIGESQGEDSIDRLRSLSEAAEKRAVEDFKERLLSEEAITAAVNGHPESWRETIEDALRAAVRTAEKGAS